MLFKLILLLPVVLVASSDISLVIKEQHDLSRYSEHIVGYGNNAAIIYDNNNGELAQYDNFFTLNASKISFDLSNVFVIFRANTIIKHMQRTKHSNPIDNNSIKEITNFYKNDDVIIIITHYRGRKYSEIDYSGINYVIQIMPLWRNEVRCYATLIDKTIIFSPFNNHETSLTMSVSANDTHQEIFNTIKYGKVIPSCKNYTPSERELHIRWCALCSIIFPLIVIIIYIISFIIYETNRIPKQIIIDTFNHNIPRAARAA